MNVLAPQVTDGIADTVRLPFLHQNLVIQPDVGAYTRHKLDILNKNYATIVYLKPVMPELG